MEKRADSKKKEATRDKEQMTEPQEQPSDTTDNLSQEQAQTADTNVSQEPVDRLKELEARLAEANEKHLRLFSEFDNYRKRTTKERIDLAKTASAEMITALLPVVDDLERASTLTETEAKGDAVAEGIKLIYSKMKTILAQKGVEEINAVGQEFDTDFHEAITHIPAADPKQKGKVVDQVQKGYILSGKVIRFARVVVAN